MEDLLGKLADFGAMGIVAGVVMYQLFRTNNKIIDGVKASVDNNTKALGELKDIIRDCQTIHKGEG